MMGAESNVEGSKDVLIIDPDRIIIKSPIKVLYQEEEIEIRNLLTFFSFRRISVRLREKIRKAATSSVRNFVCEKGYNDVEPRVELNFAEKTSRLTIKFPHDDIVEKGEVLGFVSHIFSGTCKNIPEYSVREYHLMPLISEYINLFVLLLPYRPDIKSALDTLKRILKYPFVTLPNAQGIYYSTVCEQDNLYSLPHLVKEMVRQIRCDVGRNEALSSLIRSSIESRGGQRVYIDVGEHTIPLQFVIRVLKNVVHVIDKIEDKGVIQEILQLTNKLLKGEDLTKREIMDGIRIITKAIDVNPNEDALRQLRA